MSILAKHHHATQAKYKPYINPKDGTIASTSFMDILRIKVGAKLMIIHNIDTSDGLTNGQMGELVDIIRTTKGDVDKLVMRLNNKQAGKNNRTKFPNIAKKFPECVFIERVTNQYSLRKRSGSAGATAKLIQFPVILSHAITSHKIQGQTIPSPAKVVIDLNTVFEEAQAYVMLSRVQQLDQVSRF